MRQAVFIMALAFSCAANSQEEPRSKAVAIPGSKLCARGPVGFHQLRNVVGKYLSLCQQPPLCKGQLNNVETKLLAGYTKPWLWTMTLPEGQPAPTFSVTQQDSFIASAKALAQAALPAGKTITNIDVFTDIAAPLHYTGYYVGARATYGTCVVSKQN